MIALAACSSVSPEKSEMIEENPSSMQNEWGTYTNTTYGFSVDHPPHTTIEDQANYIRLQNYTPTDAPTGLQAGEYYLEIQPSVNTTENTLLSCAEQIQESELIEVDGLNAYLGKGLPGGDAGGTRFALCIANDTHVFFVQSTENNAEGTLSDTILKSFRMTE